MSLFYRESGRGETVIILHGLYGCSDNWMTIARKLSENYQVISVDLRNHGSSPHFPSHSYNDLVLDIVLLFDDLGIEKAHILGHSMGGKVAMAFAADYPEKVISLAVVDIAPKNYLKSVHGTTEFSMNQQLLETLLSIDLPAFNSRNEVEFEIRKTIHDPFIVSFIIKNLRRGTSSFEWKINLPVLKEYLPHIIGDIDYSFFEERLPIFGYLVLFIRGERSPYIQDEDLLSIKKIYPEANFETIPDATHYLHVERPNEFIGCYLEFLKGVSYLR